MAVRWLHRPASVLLVSEDKVLETSLRLALGDIELDEDGRHPVKLELVDTWPHALKLLLDQGVAAVMVDWPDSRRELSQLERELIRLPGPPLVVLTGKANESAAVAALQNGAADYLIKEGLSSDGLVRSLRYVAERARLHQTLAEHRRNAAEAQGDVATFARYLKDDLERDWESLASDQSSAAKDQILRGAEAKIDRLVAFAEAGQAPEIQGETEVVPALKDVIHELRPLATDLAAEVELDADNVTVPCGLSAFSAIASGLVTCALKSTNGQPVRRVLISAHGREQTFVLAVADTGLGISSDSLAEVFEPRLGNGLAVLKRTVVAHGGMIDVQSTLGEGTTFQVTLPLLAIVA